MFTILLVIYIVADLMIFLVIAHIILSWLNILWVNIKIWFIDSILEPIYTRIKNSIPTNFWPFEFAPAIFILFLIIIQNFIVAYDSSIYINYKQIINF